MNQNEPANRRAEANRANAQHSTGPRTDAGKSVSKLNAVKTALTGRTVLLPDDDMDRYMQHIAEWQAELKPVGPRETALAQSIADAYWRAERIVRLEFALYAQGRLLFAEQFAEQFASTDPALQDHLIEAHTYLTYERQFRNLSTQEVRLRRQRDKDHAALEELQEQRVAADKEHGERLEQATKLADKAGRRGNPMNPAGHGFEFSLPEIEANFEKVFGHDDDEEDEARAETISEPGCSRKPDAA